MGIASKLSAMAKSGDEGKSGIGSQDEETRAMVTVPWIARTTNGIWIGEDRSVWLYRKLPPYSYTWEAAGTRLTAGDNLYQLLLELGRTSKPPAVGEFATLAKLRQIHMFSHINYARPMLPKGATPDEEAFLREIFETDQTAVSEQLTVIGIKLWPQGPLSKRRRQRSLLNQVKRMVGELTNTALPDLDDYSSDIAEISTILGRADAQVVTSQEARMVERWLSMGKTRTPFYIEEPDRLIVRERNPHTFDRWTKLHKFSCGGRPCRRTRTCRRTHR